MYLFEAKWWFPTLSMLWTMCNRCSRKLYIIIWISKVKFRYFVISILGYLVANIGVAFTWRWCLISVFVVINMLSVPWQSSWSGSLLEGPVDYVVKSYFYNPIVNFVVYKIVKQIKIIRIQCIKIPLRKFLTYIYLRPTQFFPRY